MLEELIVQLELAAEHDLVLVPRDQRGENYCWVFFCLSCQTLIGASVDWLKQVKGGICLKRRKFFVCNNVNKPGGCYVKGNKQGTEMHILMISLYT